MIKHIWRMIWNQRSHNSWIFLELLLVFGVLWVMMDSMLVDLCIYHRPLGFDITDVYKVNIGRKTEGVVGYTPDSLFTTSEGEDLLRLTDNIRRAPEVEEICLATASCPYTWSNSWTTLVSADADTTEKEQYYRQFNVTFPYFDVLRIKDRTGRPLRSIIENNLGELAVTADLEEHFFGKESAMGKKVKWNPRQTATRSIAAVSAPYRDDEFSVSSPCMFSLMRTDEDVVETVSRANAHRMDCLLRMKVGFRAEEMDAFLERMGERLEVNNLYVSSVISLEKELRPVFLKEKMDDLKKKVALVGFMLVNVFFGIVGTFWLRTQYRRGEMGLRAALGASRSTQRRYLNVEGIWLLVLTVPFILIFIANMLYFDLFDTVRMPYTWWRFLATFGGAFLLLAGMIWVGIWLPARKIMKMNPAEALHYE